LRAYRVKSGEHFTLEAQDAPRPTPGAGEVLIRNRATSLNYLDLMVARGRFGDTSGAFVPGTDGAGEIVEVGDCVRHWATGDRVAVGSFVEWSAGELTSERVARSRGVNFPGSLAEYSVVPVTSLARLHESMSFEQAATLPIAATTAWNALRRANIRTGSTVMLLGTGGVSLFALQLAKAMGARTAIISSSDEKLERARQLGADVTINYRTTPHWDEAVLKATEGYGADLVVETIGPQTFARSINVAAMAGTIYVVGFVSGMEITAPILPISLKSLRILGSLTGTTDDLSRTVKAVEVAGIAPVIDRVFPFESTSDAYAYLASGSHFGKVVISGP
jgi:NADPH:quinone reductase-like Zn-dependent oxidoreductase